MLAPLEGVQIKVEKDWVKFQTDLCHPSLFAVAVHEYPGSIPLPLRCCLYVLYPELEPDMPMVAGFDIETYIGMNVRTVATVCVCTVTVQCTVQNNLPTTAMAKEMNKLQYSD